MFKKTTLPNGLTIVEVPQKSSKTVTVLALAGTGSKYEPKKINGISHLLEHLVFKGTQKRPSQLLIAEALDKVGGSYNAFTGEEYTGYFAKVEKSHFDLALDVVSDIYSNACFRAPDIKKEKNVVLEEINMFFDHPSYYVQNLWSELLYGDQPAGRMISGTKESVKNITRKDILNYFSQQYTLANTTVVVAGNFSSAQEKIKRSFSSLSKKDFKEKEKTKQEQKKPAVKCHYRKTDQTHLCLGVRAFDVFHSQKHTLELIATLLGGMMSSRLFLTIREKLGLAYYIQTSYDKDSDTGCLVTQAGLDNNNIEKAITTILKEYQKIKEKKISLTELKKIKDHLKGSFVLSLETSNKQALFYGNQQVIKKEILTPKQICAKIDQITREDIKETAQKIFRPENLNLALVGPFKNKTNFKKILKL